MELYCAIDLRGGAAVRLRQGDFERERRFGEPVALARRLVADGAPRLHVVDLDAAASGRPSNRALVGAILAAVDVPVQVGGGVRSEADAAELLAAGADRVVLGTVALREPAVAQACARRFPQRVALGLDYRRRPDGVLEAAASGWLEHSGLGADEVLESWRGLPLAAVVLTAIERDGTATGPDLAGLGQVLEASTWPVVASGGVGGRADLEALTRLRGGNGRALAGVVVGTALLDGSLEVREAVAACAASG